MKKKLLLQKVKLRIKKLLLLLSVFYCSCQPVKEKIFYNIQDGEFLLNSADKEISSVVIFVYNANETKVLYSEDITNYVKRGSQWILEDQYENLKISDKLQVSIYLQYKNTEDICLSCGRIIENLNQINDIEINCYKK